jgi:hypothetical protein
MAVHLKWLKVARRAATATGTPMNYRTVAPLLLLLLLASCAKQEESSANLAATESAADAPAADMAGLSKQMAASEAAAPPQSVSPQATPLQPEALTSGALTPPSTGERRFVITSSLEFRVKHVLEAALKLEDLAAKHGGFVVDNTIHAETGRIERSVRSDGSVLVLSEYTTRGRLTLRVPSANTQAFIREAAPLVEFLDSRRFSAQDVHLELLANRLLADRSAAAQDKLDDLADDPGRIDQRARVIDKGTEARANRDQAEINRLLLEDRIGFSTIDLAIYQNPEINRNVVSDFDSVRRDSRPDFLPSLSASLKSGWIGLVGFLINLASMWPLMLIVIPLIGWLYRRNRKP